MSFQIRPSNEVTVTFPTPLPSGQDTQILTNVNGTTAFSYSGYNFDAKDMFSYIPNNIDTRAIYVGDLSLNVKYYGGGVLAPNGRIYCIPCNANNVGIIDPNNDTIDKNNLINF